MIYNGDCLQVLPTLEENSIDTCITDPPYELGFMGKKWDNTGVAFQPETWAAVYRVLKPGAILLAFGGTRTYHRIACAIEDAGFEIRDTIAWVYGSGFPKSYNIGKGIDKFNKTGNASWNGTGDSSNGALGYSKLQHKQGYRPNDYSGKHQNKAEITDPEAQLWHGWGTALKPAMELICVAMKPIDGTYVNNALTWGVAGLNIDGGRVSTNDNLSGGTYGGIFGGSRDENGKLPKAIGSGDKGRFPANFVHDGSDEVVGLFPNSVSRAGNPNRSNHQPNGNTYFSNKTVGQEHNDSGSAARFFYCAKASRSERNAGLEGMPDKDGGHYAQDEWSRKNMGNKPDAERKPVQNHHPTVKPLALMRYLCKLTKTPTGGIVLDPFMGSGTTGIACELEGREFIGIEREAEYVEIAEKRIEHYRLPILEEAKDE